MNSVLEPTPPPLRTPGPLAPGIALADRAHDVLGLQDGHAAPPAWVSTAIQTLDTAAGAVPAGETGTTAARTRERRRQIVRAAAELFAVHGYRGTSLRDISRRVGISHPGMLHHFKSKEALLEAVIETLEGHAQYIIDHLAAYDTTSEHLEALVRRDFSESGRRMLLFATLSTDAVNPEHPARMRVIRLRRVYEHITERMLRIYQDHGRLLEGVDPAWGARTIISLTIALATREATIGAVQPTAGDLDTPDFLSFIHLITR